MIVRMIADIIPNIMERVASGLLSFVFCEDTIGELGEEGA